MLRSTPPTSEKLSGIADENSRAKPVPYEAESSRSLPLGQRTKLTASAEEQPGIDEIENTALGAGLPIQVSEEPKLDFLRMVREAEDQALLYIAQVNRKSWAQTLRAYHQEHFVGSKYTKPDWRNRSKLFVPKTRSAIRKDQAAVAASLFNNIDAINCLPGDEADPKQRAAAAVMEELVNYRTDRSSGRAAIPWFQVAMGARQDATLTGICVSKQFWKLKLRKLDEPERYLEQNEGAEEYTEKLRDVWVADYDRPDIMLFPPENVIIDPAADWTNPAQSASYLILKYPMRMEEIRERQNSPVNPWKKLSEEVLKNSTESGKFDMAAIRRARELGLDRLDETQTGTHFQIIWIYEVFIKAGENDYTFYSIGDKEFLTDPKPVREVYPEQHGERPLAYGFGSLESHRIYPMSPAESWQMLQLEINDFRNLQLDAIKQNVMPVSKIVRGRQIDMDQVKRRSSGSSIIVTDPKDVTWERPPDVPQSAPMMVRELELEFDDLAGQFNAGTTENNNALSRTLGGLKLVAGSANAVQEFDIRVWIQTWAEPVLEQIVRLEQYYEADPVVLGLVGARAQMFQKFGISRIDDDLLEQDITIRINVGLGAADPQARLAKFQSAVQVAVPLLQMAPQFQDGSLQIDAEAVMEEVFGAAGYKDGGRRFVKQGPPKPNPLGDLPAQKLQSEIEKNKAQARNAVMTGVANLGKVQLGDRTLQAETANDQMDRQLQAMELGHGHAHQLRDQMLSASDHGHRHGLAIRQHHADQQQAHLDRQHQADQADADRQAQAQQAAMQPSEGGGGGEAPEPQQPQQAQQPQPDVEEIVQQVTQARRPERYDLIRGANNRIVGLRPVYANGPPGPASNGPAPGAPPPMPPNGSQIPPLPPSRPGQEVPLPSFPQAAPSHGAPGISRPASPPVRAAPRPQSKPAPRVEPKPPKPEAAPEPKLSSTLAQLVQHLSKPKKVVRDKDNRIVGVESA